MGISIKESVRRSVDRSIYGRYCEKLVMEPCQIFQYQNKNIDIYDTTSMSFVPSNFESISRADPRFWGALCKTVSTGGFGLWLRTNE